MSTSDTPIDITGDGMLSLCERGQQLYYSIQKEPHESEGNYVTWGRSVLGFLPLVTRGQGISQDVILLTTCAVLVAAEVNGPPIGVMDHQQIYIMNLTKEVLNKLKVAFDLDGILEAIVSNETF